MPPAVGSLPVAWIFVPSSKIELPWISTSWLPKTKYQGDGRIKIRLDDAEVDADVAAVTPQADEDDAIRVHQRHALVGIFPVGRFPFEQLRRHKVGSASQLSGGKVVTHNAFCQSEIGQFGNTTRSDQNVVRLGVAMHNTVLQFPGVVKDKQLGTFTRPGRPERDP